MQCRTQRFRQQTLLTSVLMHDAARVPVVRASVACFELPQSGFSHSCVCFFCAATPKTLPLSVPCVEFTRAFRGDPPSPTLPRAHPDFQIGPCGRTVQQRPPFFSTRGVLALRHHLTLQK